MHFKRTQLGQYVWHCAKRSSLVASPWRSGVWIISKESYIDSMQVVVGTILFVSSSHFHTSFVPRECTIIEFEMGVVCFPCGIKLDIYLMGCNMSSSGLHVSNMFYFVAM